MDNQVRARVFISCGQQKDSDETKIAQDIADKLSSMGFEPYIAVTEQTLKGVKENIFRRLSESEYLIFVDFKRDRLCQIENGKLKDTGKHRGSLFSNQELAIATYLDIESVAFQEQGVWELDGILRFIQANCIPFIDRLSLPDLVAEKVKEKIDKKEWDAHWRHELILKREDSKDYVKVDWVGDPQNQNPARYYHIEVENLHWNQTARNCSIYLERLENITNGEVLTPELVEFKWKGIITPTAMIPPRQYRYADAFHIFHVTPKTVLLGFNEHIVDYTGYLETHMLGIATEHNLTFVVYSDNFPPARKTFRLNMGNKLDDIEFYELSNMS